MSSSSSGNEPSARRSAIGRLAGVFGFSRLGPCLRGDDPSARRSAIGRLAAVLVLSGGWAGCGFRLRGERTLPFESIYLGFPPNSPLGAELARSIRAGTPTRVVTDPARAQAILEVLGEAREREVLAINAQGRTREYQLRLRFAFRVHDGRGGEYVAPSTVAIQRDIAFNEAQVLAREAEEAVLFREMSADLVQQVLRRLAAAQPPRAS
jgi:LPS-assembly lipoprotein